MIKLYFAEVEDSQFHSECFTRIILGKNLSVDSDSLVICKSEFGKPYLRDYPNVYYNISHTKGVIVCAVSNKPVGVDIERIKKFNHRIVERFFTQNEQNYILSMKENQNERFTEIWTMKEAYVKWLGTGMKKPFNTFDVIKLNNDVFIYTKYINRYIVSICNSLNCNH